MLAVQQIPIKMEVVEVLLRDFKVSAWVALGANLGDAAGALKQALEAIQNIPATHLEQSSSFYKTAAIDSSGPDYINAVVRLTTFLSAPDLLKELFKIEQKHGRERPYVNAPRTLDLDLLLFGNSTIQSQFLQVPHPRMYQRAFVLFPLHDVSTQLVSQAQLNAVSDQVIERLTNE